tara:strand:+ start:3700 stop:4278 length:579 start_codon:yes stop_codon:yes gene_type:complete
MGLTESKSLTYRDSIEVIRKSIIDDTLNVDFLNCINNLPHKPIKLNDDLSCYNIINRDNIGVLLLLLEHIKKNHINIEFNWGDLESGSIPIINIDQLENEIDGIYFITDLGDLKTALTNNTEWYIIGKLKSGIFFTLYLNLNRYHLSKNVSKKGCIQKILFYNEAKNISSEDTYSLIKYKYNNDFFCYLDSL